MKITLEREELEEIITDHLHAKFGSLIPDGHKMDITIKSYGGAEVEISRLATGESMEVDMEDTK